MRLPGRKTRRAPTPDIARPRFRLHAAFGGVVPLATHEPLLPLIESRLPSDWLALAEDTQFDTQLRAVAGYLAGFAELVAEIDVADRGDLTALEACAGARPGSRPYQVRLPLTPQNLEVVLSTNPGSLWVTTPDGTPVLLLQGNWDGVFVY